jgi:hypothetical protein
MLLVFELGTGKLVFLGARHTDKGKDFLEIVV